MRKLAILTFLSLDGVMQAPMSPQEDPSGGFERGGWAAPYYGDMMNQVQQEAMNEPYDMLFGRNTYNQFACHWPTVDPANPVARMMNQATKFVATNAGDPLPWQNTTILRGDLATQIAELKTQAGPLIQVHGSWQLIQLLLAEDLIDEFRLWTFPLILGSGKRLFSNPKTPASLQLVKTASNPNGVTMSIYRAGSFNA